ncbi:hypothetical protein [Rhodoferax sp. PAMC 29310]|uniref:hypothetical protein n=1 Tax=Rhodoferax sp. PAMC 29310 TaxID=2822760 RepID=UPI001B33138E|nr:hypothetical protein [Rhodoferax sp. PAMC 29310]
MSWLTVLKLVPWTDVIKNAPAVADGAKKLWKSVGKNEAAEAGEAPASPASALSNLPESQAIALLERQIGSLEITVDELHQQMRESSELIKALADQNTQLIKRVEVNRRRIWVLAGLVLILGLTGALAMARPLIG